MALQSRSHAGILTIYFTDARILDDSKIREVALDLEQLLGRSEEEKVILDFRSVEFMSSSFLGTLIQFNKRCKEYKAKLKLCNISANIREVFRITKLDKIFAIEKDEESARAAFAKRGLFG
ncbi:MAG: STAS domain-containing protein [Pirellulales bacterium]|nr:STAS domain-containing protein [Pirellulales bacterium]